MKKKIYLIRGKTTVFGAQVFKNWQKTSIDDNKIETVCVGYVC